MRLWHKSMIPSLARRQLLGQWRECCCIAKSLATNGTPNHILVNKILDYPIEHFIKYTCAVIIEMQNRGYKLSSTALNNFQNNMIKYCGTNTYAIDLGDVFPQWHNDRYLKQNYMNLQEKFDCGGISKEEWDKIEKEFGWYDNEL